MEKHDFEEYIRQVEPSAKESADAWKTAIGLQEVDGLKPSSYLLETARKNIEGDITIDEVRQLLDSYYRNKTTRTAQDYKHTIKQTSPCFSSISNIYNI
ncbi:MAG: antitoxin VbhA family protein [Paludibacteraceae bacterium]|nr:antitoxin VbhA family protein [Paludibacteraceae bacterium]